MTEPSTAPTPDAPPAFYALAAGGWRDYITLLHPPYTAWHLSYVCIGWAVVPGGRIDRLVALLVAFFFAVGVAAHALDELNGRPLRTRIPSRALVAMSVASLAIAAAIGVVGASRAGWGLLPFIGVGTFLVLTYNLEWFGGRFHSDAWFAIAWGAFPSLTASFAASMRVTPSAVAAATACLLLSAAQRTLSTPVRELRRRTQSVTGSIVTFDGTVRQIDRDALRKTPEDALRMLSLAMPLVAVAVVLMRVDG